MEARAPLPTPVSGIEHSVSVHLRLGRGEDRWGGAGVGGQADNRRELSREKTNVPKLIAQDFHRSLNIYLELEILLRNS